MTYAVVEDVAASWEHYERFAEALAGPVPAGLILHAAGPTDEGFRIIGVWESEEAWERFRVRQDAVIGDSDARSRDAPRAERRLDDPGERVGPRPASGESNGMRHAAAVLACSSSVWPSRRRRQRRSRTRAR